MQGISLCLSVCLSYYLDNHSSHQLHTVLLRTQGNAVSSVKSIGWAVLKKAASSNTGSQAMGPFWTVRPRTGTALVLTINVCLSACPISATIHLIDFTLGMCISEDWRKWGVKYEVVWISGSWESCTQKYRRPSNWPIPNGHGLNGYCTSWLKGKEYKEDGQCGGQLTQACKHGPLVLQCEWPCLHLYVSDVCVTVCMSMFDCFVYE